MAQGGWGNMMSPCVRENLKLVASLDLKVLILKMWN
jgi:hypothetical protein